MADAKSQLDEALDAFAAEGVLVERSLLAPILTTSGAAIATKDARFSSGLARIADTLRSGHPEALEALAFAWRATSVTSMREHRRRLVELLTSGAVTSEFNDLPTRMQDPDDRRHVADALLHLPAEWQPRYVARAIVAERDGEKARESLCRALLQSLPVLAEEIALVGEALTRETFEQLEPEIGRARRATSILDAFATALWASETDVEPGERFGEQLADLASFILLRRAPSDRNVSTQFAAALVNYVIVATRLHGSLAASAKTYAFLAPMRRAFGAGNWPEVVQTQMSRASAQVLDQLLLLVRLGMPDAELRRVFVTMTGEAEARRRLSVAVEREPSFGSEGAHWLVTGTARRTLATHAAVAETAVSAIDTDIGLALRDTDLIDTSLKQLLPDLQAAAEFHSPMLAIRLSQMADRIERLTATVRNAAQKRGLELKGEPGEIVNFSPVEHEPSQDAIGERTVRLINRAVERIVDGKSVGIVVKADVDKA